MPTPPDDDDFLEDLRREVIAAERVDTPVKVVAESPRLAEVVDADPKAAAAARMHDFLSGSVSEPPEGSAIFYSGNKKLDELLKHHAPRDWQELAGADRIWHLIESGETVPMIVMSADIRKSTLLMRETVDFREFAATISDFVSVSARFIRWGRGWFDKFTGDGLLAYWLVHDKQELPGYIESALQTAHHVLKTFNQRTLKRLKHNSRNFPAGVGMSVGLDAGPAHLVTVAHALTIVGHPVVGAVRMCNSAKEPGQLVCNVRVGEEVYRRRDELLPDTHYDVMPLMGATKEYAQQETYLVEFSDLWDE